VDFVHFYDYLVAARRRLLEWVRSQPSEVCAQQFAIGLGSIRTTLAHMAAMEWSYAQRLAGNDYGPEDNPFGGDRYPDVEALLDAWERQAPTVREVLCTAGAADREVVYVSRSFVPPMRTRTTVGGIAGQLLFHEVHHRAQVTAMLRQVGVAAENLDYSRLNWQRVPVAMG